MGGCGGRRLSRPHPHMPENRPRLSVSNVVGKLKGRSAMILLERHPERRRLAGRGRTLWARGCHVSAVGLNESVTRGTHSDRRTAAA